MMLVFLTTVMGVLNPIASFTSSMGLPINDKGDKMDDRDIGVSTVGVFVLILVDVKNLIDVCSNPVIIDNLRL